MNRRLIDITEEELRKILREEKGKDEIALTAKEMEGKTVPKATAARFIGIAPQRLHQLIKEKKVAVSKNGEVPFIEVVREMKKRAA